MTARKPIPVIDLFAGPGGLGEGFSSLRDRSGNRAFRIGLSVETDDHAHRTLLLRSFYRQFEDGPPSDYYAYLTGGPPHTLEELLELYPLESEAAQREAWCGTLGKAAPQTVNRRIECALGRTRGNFVLIGGPPCQAYSIAGRSRMNGSARFAEDERHTLYREYLRIIRKHRPAVFVMENVKGLLSSKHRDRLILRQILRDLARPIRGLEYQLVALASVDDETLFDLRDTDNVEPESFLVEAEQYGVPQARHRIIIVGIKSGFRRSSALYSLQLRKGARTHCADVIEDLPPIRSALSRGLEKDEAWASTIRKAARAQWVREVESDHSRELARLIREYARNIDGTLTTGGRFIEACESPTCHARWYLDPNLTGVCNHESRSHIPDDLHRYLFVSCYGELKHFSPRIRHFPANLLPNHANISLARGNGMFNDRFRVQLWEKPATTVTAHIAKDGHYFIHPDPSQCRSLTVREAARLQTFPDNYFFEGPRTEQYRQVGNAVPPLLARQIAIAVHTAFEPGEQLE